MKKLPDGWKIKVLTEVCDFQGGSQPPKEQWLDHHQDGYIQMLQIRDFTQDRDDKKEYIKISNTIKTCNKGDILIARYGASLGKILTGLSGAYNVALMKTIPDLSLLSKEYLLYFLKSSHFQHYILNIGSRAAQAGFNKSDLERLNIFLPPLDVQKQIAEVLDKADELRQKKKQANAKLDEFLQSIFLDMFGDPIQNPQDFALTQIREVIERFEGGKSIVGSDDDSVNNGYKVLKISAVTWKDFRPYESKALPVGYQPPINHIVKRSDLLFSRANTTELVGATSYVFNTPNNIVLPDKLWRFVWKEPKKVEPLYIWYVLMQKSMRNLIGSLATGTGGSMKNISQAKVLSIKIPLPPIKLQNKFAQIVEKVEEQKAKNEIAIQKLDDLFNSLLQRAFKGELEFKSENKLLVS